MQNQCRNPHNSHDGEGCSGKLTPTRHDRSRSFVNPYLFAPFYGLCYAPLSIVVSSVSPLARSLRGLSRWLWSELPILSRLFPYQEARVPLWVSGASLFWTAVAMGLFLLLVIGARGWTDIIVPPVLASMSAVLFRRLLFEHYYRMVGFWTFEQSDIGMPIIILAGFATGMLLGFLTCLVTGVAGRRG